MNDLITWLHGKQSLLWLLFVLILASLAPAMCFSPGREDRVPPHAFPNYATQTVDSNVMRSAAERVRILIDRKPRLDRPPRYIRFLLWSPLSVAVFSVWIFSRTHPKASMFHSLVLVLVGGATIAVVMMCREWTGLSLLLVIPTLFVLVWGFRTRDVDSNRNCSTPLFRVRLHFLIVSMLVILGAVLSSSTHVLLADYAGYPPGTDKPFAGIAKTLDHVIHQKTPPYIRDDSAWRMNHIPALNRGIWRMTLFGLNRVAAWTFIAVMALYTFLWPTVIGPDYHLNHPSTPPRHDRVARLIFPFYAYVATGFAFAVIFYSYYTTAAARQNVMATYADYLIADAGRAKQLEDYFKNEGWSDSIEQQILQQARFRQSKAVSIADWVEKTRARYWPSAVIAHETPRVREKSSGNSPAKEDGSMDVETEFAVDPIMSFHDMVYFSFVSFTTTGYGDIRPVSEDLRYWTVIENIVEIMFLTMVIGVAVDVEK